MEEQNDDNGGQADWTLNSRTGIGTSRRTRLNQDWQDSRGTVKDIPDEGTGSGFLDRVRGLTN